MEGGKASSATVGSLHEERTIPSKIGTMQTRKEGRDRKAKESSEC